MYLGALYPEAIRVELYAEGRNGGDTVKAPMERVTRLPDGGFLYSATVEDGRDPNDFTARVVPYHLNATVPLEADHFCGNGRERKLANLCCCDSRCELAMTESPA